MLLCAFADADDIGLGAAVYLRTPPRAFANARFRPFGGAALASFARRGMGRAAVAHGLVLAAVSYTHLAVYKRQPFFLWLLIRQKKRGRHDSI